jgi:hypothetical protein
MGEKFNKILLVMAIVLVLISIISTAIIVNTINMARVSTPPPRTGGEVRLTVLKPTQSTKSSTSGTVGLTVLPKE